MKANVGDRVVHKDNVTIGGTVVSSYYLPDTRNYGLFATMIYNVLWDNSVKIMKYHSHELYPESITMTSNRQPNLANAIKELAQFCHYIDYQSFIKKYNLH